MVIKKFNESLENSKLDDVNLVTELNSTFDAVEVQLMKDEKRWGDTWKERGLVYNGQSQEDRWFDKMKEYYDDYVQNGTPIPWSKTIGESHIALVREKLLK